MYIAERDGGYLQEVKTLGRPGGACFRSARIEGPECGPLLSDRRGEEGLRTNGVMTEVPQLPINELSSESAAECGKICGICSQMCSWVTNRRRVFCPQAARSARGAEACLLSSKDCENPRERMRSSGWHCLSNATSLIRPLLFYALLIVSRIIIIWRNIRDASRKHALDK